VDLPAIEFRIDQAPEPDGTVRLTVRGEIDIATAGQLRDALDSHHSSDTAVRLDLSQIGFVDSSGLAVLIAAKRQAVENGWTFEIARQLSPPVQRLFALSGVETFLWR
jgi:anti-sigma B factor antagonist